mmetsp:Transcript_1632/g.1454  ORF Transcript_1632/g.1454 Transcript_1632/m.1454 type:complete len:103 (-) Transcript_1632:402-710(-)
MPNANSKAQDNCPEHHMYTTIVCLDCKIRCCQKCLVKGLHKDHQIDILGDFSANVRSKEKEIKDLGDKAEFHHECIKDYVQKFHNQAILDVNNSYDKIIGLL